jgi:hypothetical protein
VADTKALKVIVGFENGETGHCGAIEHEGAVWLVPKWLPFPDEGYTKPERMIRLDQFRHQAIPQPAEADYGVNEPMPKSLFFGELSPRLKEKYVVIDRPDLKFRAGGTRN